MDVKKNGGIKRVGVLTGGGDCPGLNAVIRVVAKKAINDYGIEVVGIEDGYQGLMEMRTRDLTFMNVSGILTEGGTILGTSNKANPFSHPVRKGDKLVFMDKSDDAVNNFKKLQLDALVCIGGDGTLQIALKLFKKGIPIVGIPKTIDNDLCETDYTFGFNTALETATEAIDKIHSTAQSHHRVMLVEVMGRYAGWIALHSGLAGGGDIILIPEIPFSIESVCEWVTYRSKTGKKFSLVVVAEGAKPKGGIMVVKKVIKDSPDPVRLGGIGNRVGDEIERLTGLETRVAVLGHLQRGGVPSAYDRILATRFGSYAVDLLMKKSFGNMVAIKGDDIVSVPISKAVKRLKLVDPKSALIKTARSVGTCMGD